MVTFRKMVAEESVKIKEIDRSETINLIYVQQGPDIVEVVTDLECVRWDEDQIRQLEERYHFELINGGTAVGSFDNELLVGFGVLAHNFRGANRDQLQVDLMYVSQNYRRQGIATRIIQELSWIAKRKGAKYLYISSTETESAVNFYRSCGSAAAEEIDPELFEKEPKDIHMIITL